MFQIPSLVVGQILISGICSKELDTLRYLDAIYKGCLRFFYLVFKEIFYVLCILVTRHTTIHLSFLLIVNTPHITVLNTVHTAIHGTQLSTFHGRGLFTNECNTRQV